MNKSGNIPWWVYVAAIALTIAVAVAMQYVQANIWRNVLLGGG